MKSLDECDDCNERFSGFEDDLAKMTIPTRSIGGVIGKNGVPKLVAASRGAAHKPTMEFKDSGLHVSHDAGDIGFVDIAANRQAPVFAPAAWATLPGAQWLAMGRRLHFFFAWIFVVNAAIYGILMVASGHLWRNLLPSGPNLRHIGRSLWDHLRLRFPRGEEAKHYNVLQKLAYLIVVLALGPVSARSPARATSCFIVPIRWNKPWTDRTAGTTKASILGVPTTRKPSSHMR
jgi:hypothetical protein